jgi:hypothetical protein
VECERDPVCHYDVQQNRCLNVDAFIIVMSKWQLLVYNQNLGVKNQYNGLVCLLSFVELMGKVF